MKSDCVRLSAWYANGKKESVVRLFEYRGRGGTVVLRIPAGLRAWRCDLKEQALEEYPVEADGSAERKGTIRLCLRPFEILTVKLVGEDET